MSVGAAKRGAPGEGAQLTGPVLAVHGGAGNFGRRDRGDAGDRARRAGIARSLRVGIDVLAADGSAVDAVERAVRELEDCEEFNAGRGSVLTARGTIEMDAAISRGTDRGAGAVAAVRRIANPIAAARAVLEQSCHVLLVGEGAEEFARANGIAFCSDADLVTDSRRHQLERARQGRRISLDHDGDVGGTVGAVARDARGNLAAATSTGGMTNQLPGRVGDTPLIGAGIWADNATCAISGTGVGEAYIRVAFAHEVDALVRLAGLGLAEACSRALDRLDAVGGSGGCIAVASTGPAVLRFNTRAMPCGQVGSDGEPEVRVYADE